MITFEDVSKTYAGPGGQAGDRAALAGVSLSVAPGEVFGVIGASGAGKSTLIRLINGLETPSGGKVIVDGDDVAALGVEGLRSLRRRVGMTSCARRRKRCWPSRSSTASRAFR